MKRTAIGCSVLLAAAGATAAPTDPMSQFTPASQSSSFEPSVVPAVQTSGTSAPVPISSRQVGTYIFVP